MLTAEVLARRPDFTIRTVHCHDHRSGWSRVEPATGHQVVLVRAGRFRRAGRTGAMLADRTVGYRSLPGDEERFAHPAGGDVCTSVRLSAALWRELTGDAGAGSGPVYVDARLDLAHRLLLRAARTGDPDHAVAERLARLVAAAMAGPVPDHPGSGPRGGRTVEMARQAITAGHPAAAGLLPLARWLDVSPYRLSRDFQRLVGVPLTRFRNRVRVTAAVERLEQGEPSLAALAADLGFADQAHLTRTVRAHLGHTPTALRRLLSGSAR